ncbi:hypothetical protein RFI_40079 [Reticulomyxa filosa]|uniref:Uncharacterized protein n=1 Tax=Reticulomyxa filosa TaxID=46433 RepID=X6L7R0_RETFI|nr:hypothetical protein RFI_40079 [Reticulomyxa filosa]|eukprot:ETN97450.1 hypothetical protein RFI_40079 [Reticulomyxa filosa]
MTSVSSSSSSSSSTSSECTTVCVSRSLSDWRCNCLFSSIGPKQLPGNAYHPFDYSFRILLDVVIVTVVVVVVVVAGIDVVVDIVNVAVAADGLFVGLAFDQSHCLATMPDLDSLQSLHWQFACLVFVEEKIVSSVVVVAVAVAGGCIYICAYNCDPPLFLLTLPAFILFIAIVDTLFFECDKLYKQNSNTQKTRLFTRPD